MYSKLSGWLRFNSEFPVTNTTSHPTSEPFYAVPVKASTTEVDSCTKCNAHAHLMICEAARRHGWDIEQVTSLIASKDRT
jgi:hypothetical protein